MSTKIFRPARSSYVLFAVVCGLPTLVFVVACLAYSDLHKLQLFEAWAIPGLGYLFAWLYIRSNEIRIEEDRIVFRSLFGGTRSMLLSHISHIAITEFVYETWREKNGPPIKLRVYPASGSGSSQISINARLFRGEDLEYILETFDGTATRNFW